MNFIKGALYTDTINIQADAVFDGYPVSLILNGGALTSGYGKKTNSFHAHLFYEIHLIISGRYVIRADGGEHIARTGDIYIIPPETGHCIDAAGKNGSEADERVAFWFDIGAYEKKFERSFLLGTFSKISSIIKVNGIDFKGIIQVMFDEIKERKPHYVEYLTNEIMNLIIRICREINENKAFVNFDYGGRNNIVISIDDHIDKNFNGNCTLYGLAEELHISRRHLSRLIQSLYSKSFKRMLLEKRMSTANWLIREGKSLSEVAQSVGYSTLSSFYHAYKNFYGVTPAGNKK